MRGGYSAHTFIVRLSALVYFFPIVVLGLNVWTGYNVELADWTINSLVYWRTLFFGLLFLATGILLAAMLRQGVASEDPSNLPLVIQAQLILTMLTLFITVTYTIFMYSYWVLILWPTMRLIVIIYRNLTPNNYDEQVQDYCITFMGVFLWGCLIFTTICFWA